MPRAGGAGKCYKSIHGQLCLDMWEYELIRYRLEVGGRPPARGRPLLQVIGPGSSSGAPSFARSWPLNIDRIGRWRTSQRGELASLSFLGLFGCIEGAVE